MEFGDAFLREVGLLAMPTDENMRVSPLPALIRAMDILFPISITQEVTQVQLILI